MALSRGNVAVQEFPERLVAPQPQGPSQHRRRFLVGRATSQGTAGRGTELLEPCRVQALGWDPQQIARFAGDQHFRGRAASAIGLQHTPQVHDMGLQGLAGASGRLFAPQPPKERLH